MSSSAVFWIAVGLFFVVAGLYLLHEMIKFRRVSTMFATQNAKIEVNHDQLTDTLQRLQVLEAALARLEERPR